MKAIKILYNILSAVLITAVVSVTLLALLLGVSGMDKENPKSIIGFRAFIVLSDSMSPAFKAGSLIIIKQTDADKLEVGDIITYRPGGSGDVLLTHRIVGLNGGEVITRGDANNADDKPIASGAVLGRTVFYMNGLGTFVINLRTPTGILVMILTIGAGLFLIPYLFSIGEKPRRKKTGEIYYDEDDEIEADDVTIDYKNYDG